MHRSLPVVARALLLSGALAIAAILSCRLHSARGRFAYIETPRHMLGFHEAASVDKELKAQEEKLGAEKMNPGKDVNRA